VLAKCFSTLNIVSNGPVELGIDEVW